MDHQRRLPRTSPEAAGVDRGALERLFAALDGLVDVHSAMVLRHGAVVAETWWAPHAAEQRHQMFSVSKAFTAMAVGIAVDEGLLTVEDRVIDLLPDQVPAEVSDNLAAMRVEHLLTMTSGHAESSMSGLDRTIGRPEDDWVRAVLAADVPLEPGSRFVYDTGATYLLSAILHRLTGVRLLEYLRPRLLEPLGITGATWEQDGQGIDVGGFGLSITTEDMAAFGQLLLQRGRWGDAQFVPAAWIDRACSHLVDPEPQEGRHDWAAGYGFQLWRCTVDAARADGAFGQFVIVWPEHNAVIALTSGLEATQRVLDAVWQALADAFGEPGPGGDAPLAPRHERPVPSGAPSSARESDLLGHVYAFPAVEAPWSIERDGAQLLVRRYAPTGEVVDVIHAGHGGWATGSSDGDAVAAAYAWTTSDSLEVVVVALGTPFVWTLTAVFDRAGSVELTCEQNVTFAGPTSWTATGRPVSAPATR